MRGTGRLRLRGLRCHLLRSAPAARRAGTRIIPMRVLAAAATIARGDHEGIRTFQMRMRTSTTGKYTTIRELCTLARPKEGLPELLLLAW